MLDRSIEFHSIIMRHPNDYVPILHDVPDGFTLRFYEKGDEDDWADIQVSVTEFPNRTEALKCYDYYLQYMDELVYRLLFIIDDITGKPVSTATAWDTCLAGYSDLELQGSRHLYGFGICSNEKDYIQ